MMVARWSMLPEGMGVSSATIHRWKSKYGGITLPELKHLKALEEENARLKWIVAKQALDLGRLG